MLLKGLLSLWRRSIDWKDFLLHDCFLYLVFIRKTVGFRDFIKGCINRRIEKSLYHKVYDMMIESERKYQAYIIFLLPQTPKISYT